MEQWQQFGIVGFVVWILRDLFVRVLDKKWGPTKSLSGLADDTHTIARLLEIVAEGFAANTEAHRLIHEDIKTWIAQDHKAHADIDKDSALTQQAIKDVARDLREIRSQRGS